MSNIWLNYGGKGLKFGSGIKVSVPAGLPPIGQKTVRFDFKYDHFDPTALTDYGSLGATWTHVEDDIYDFYYDNANWGARRFASGATGGLFNAYAYKGDSFYIYPMTQHQFDVLDMDLTDVTDVSSLFNSAWTAKKILSIRNTSSVTNFSYFIGHNSRMINIPNIPFFDTSSATNVSYMFIGCRNVESGALAMYQQMSTQANPPSTYNNCFTKCGSATTTGAAELAQIPTSWGGTMA